MGYHRRCLMGGRHLGQTLCPTPCFLCFLPRYRRGTKSRTIEVVATLATAYYQLLMLDKQKKVLEQTIDFRQKSLETTKHLKEAGSTTEVATKQIEALVYNAQAQLVTIGNSIWALENTICVLLGEEPHTIERTTLAQQQFPTEFKQGYAAKLLQNRPDVARAELSLRNAFEMTNVARAAFYPYADTLGSWRYFLYRIGYMDFG